MMSVDAWEPELPPLEMMSGMKTASTTALHPGPIPRHVAAERLWPHLEPRSALSSLRTALFRLSAGAGLLDTGPGYIAIAADVEVDVHPLEAVARRLIDGLGA